MLVRPRFELPTVRSMHELQLLLDCMTAFNRGWRSLHPNVPPLYRSGVRYRREYPREDWRTLPVLIRKRFGDCEDLACARAAELPGARAIARSEGPGLFHIVVRHASGRIEDPSVRLGMKGRA